MKTSVDTNALSRLLGGGPDGQEALRLMQPCQDAGALVACPIVYAEMLANPKLERQTLDRFLFELKIEVDYLIKPEVWLLAGQRFGNYRKQRLQSGGGEPRRLLADFIIGAHALLQADQLLTFDGRTYESYFPELRLVELD